MPPTVAKSGGLRNLSGPASQPALGLTDLELTVLQAAVQQSQLVPCRTGLGVPQVVLGVLEPRAGQSELVGGQGHGLQHAAGGLKVITRYVIQLAFWSSRPRHWFTDREICATVVVVDDNVSRDHLLSRARRHTREPAAWLVSAPGLELAVVRGPAKSRGPLRGEKISNC